MRVVILAGGFGTRLSEETEIKPKPMIEIGGMPLLVHLMKNFAEQGHKEFIICLGYKAEVIKEYFANLSLHLHDIYIDFNSNLVIQTTKGKIDWKIHLVDTGLQTQTGGRLKRIQHLVGEEDFIMTYGDGLSDVSIENLQEFHSNHKRLVTVTAVQPPGRFGALDIDFKGNVSSFIEKPLGDSGWINGGFFILKPGIFEYLIDEMTPWESDPLRNLARDSQVAAYKHFGFWKPCDTLRDKRELEDLWKSGAPWKNWS